MCEVNCWSWALIRDGKHGTAITAAALAIYSLEKEELLNLKKMKGGHNIYSNAHATTIKEESLHVKEAKWW